MTQAAEQLRRELSTQLRMITKCINTALDQIDALEEQCSSSIEGFEKNLSEMADAQAQSNAKLKVMSIQQHLFNIIFVNFQHSMNESFDAYLGNSFSNLQDDKENRKVIEITKKKNRKVQDQLISFHRKHFMKLCKYFDTHVPRILCLDISSSHLSENNENMLSINALAAGVNALGGMVSWKFFPHFTNYVVQIGCDETSLSEDEAEDFFCYALHRSTPIISFKWLKKCIATGKWLPIRYKVSNTSLEIPHLYAPSHSLSKHTLDLIGSLDKLPFKATPIETLPQSKTTEKKGEDDYSESSSQDEEKFTQDSSLYLENALRIFEQQTERVGEISPRQNEHENEFTSFKHHPRKVSRADIESNFDEASKKKRFLTRKSPDVPKKLELLPYRDAFFPEEERNSNKHKETLLLESQVVQYVHTHQHQLGDRYNSKRILCFQFTSSSPKGEFLDIITELGSTFDISPQYASVATHLIVSDGAHTKSEKVLDFSVEGKWIVSEQFLLDSKRNGDWADEDDYEIHREGSYAKFIRKNLHRPFEGWKILLVTMRESHKRTTTMFLLGGADKVIRGPDKKKNDDFTHVVYDSWNLTPCSPTGTAYDYHKSHHQISLTGHSALEQRVRSKKILLVALEYIQQVFSDFVGNYRSDTCQNTLGIDNSEASDSLSSKKLQKFMENIDTQF